MTDLSILDELEEIGIKTISMIQIIGDKVPPVQREVYISQNVEYTCFTFDPEEAHTELSDQDRSYNYTYHYKYPHPISFKDQFYLFGDSLRLFCNYIKGDLVKFSVRLNILRRFLRNTTEGK